ncbi:FGGY family carbohydrate kinase [Pseudonocardia sp. NPDC049635]|uniref:FGGY family carbohydrate kinase n=1 Tax=Pseudonocardia sp. NPDC049635 TaxID=3155506 RepID=UPI0033EEF2F1
MDAGTTVVKAVVFDAQGRELAVQRRATVVDRPLPDRAEQDMDEVWEAVVHTVATTVARVGRPVRLIAVTAQGDGVWLVDAAGRPVRPAVLWNDGRAAQLLDHWRTTGLLDEVRALTGSQQSAGMAPPLLCALAREEPGSLRAAACTVTCGGWLLFNLTGRLAVDPSEVSASWLDIRSGHYCEELVGLYGLEPHRGLLPPLLEGADRVRPLTASAGARLGVPAGTPVLLAPYDIVATAAGSGTTRPGQAVSVLGTTLCTEVVTAGLDLTGPPHGLTLAPARPGATCGRSRRWPGARSSTGWPGCWVCPERPRCRSWPRDPPPAPTGSGCSPTWRPPGSALRSWTSRPPVC